MIPETLPEFRTILTHAAFPAALAVLSAAPTSAHADRVITLNEPRPLLVHVLAPKQVEALVRAPDVLGAVANALLPTRRSLLSLEQGAASPDALTRCRGERRLSCWVRAIGPSGGTQKTHPQLFLAVGVRPGGGGDIRMSSMLLDLEHAERIVESSEDPGELEDRIYSEATVRTTPRIVAATRDAMQAYFEHLFLGELESFLPTSPSGSIRITDPIGGQTIDVDETRVGVTVRGRTLVSGLSEGPHRVDIRGAIARQEVLHVSARSTSALELTLDDAPASRSTAGWIAAGTLVAGAALTVAGAVSRSSNKLHVCPSGLCEPPTQNEALLPLGVGLSVAGAVGLIGVFVEGESFALWTVVSAVSLGGASAALAASL